MVFENEGMTWEDRLAGCQEAIGVCFDDLEILRHCLTHSSTAPTRLESNERLEFLGDAVIQLALTEALYGKYPNAREGELTKARSGYARGDYMAQIARRLERM